MADATNLKDTIIPKSDQLNAEQLISGPMTITATGVSRCTGDQPVAISYANDDGRPYKPCKTMRKVLIFAWGDDGRQWVGKSMTLFCDPEIKFGGVKVGGIRISHLSHIERDMGLSLNLTKGKKGEFIIKKLTPSRPIEELRRILSASAKSGTKDLQAMWRKLNEAERSLFSSVCPEEYKKAAADFDAGVPSNIPPATATADELSRLRLAATDLGITEAEICAKFKIQSLDVLPASLVGDAGRFISDPVGM